MHLVISCYVQRRGDMWEAACPNLNVTARAQTFLEAYQSLGRRIHEYANYVEVLPDLAPGNAAALKVASANKKSAD